MSDGFRPISPVLYQYLRQRFGQVKVASPGYGMVANRAQQPDGSSRMQIISSGEYYRVCCPFCGDSRFRLWINHRYGQLNEEGRRDTWLAYCYNEDCLSEYHRRKELEEVVFGFMNRQERKQLVLPISQADHKVQELKPHQMPGYCRPINDLPVTHSARAYVEGTRGFPADWLYDQYRVSLCEVASPDYRRMAGRLIIPIYKDHICVGWQARIPYDLEKSAMKASGEVKYYTCPTMPKSQVLYNYDVARHYPFIVVAEGVTDVWAIGPYGVATLGSSLSWHQKSMLMYENRGKPIVFMWDADAWDDKEGEVADFRRGRTNPVVNVVLPDETDPGDFDPEAHLRMIYSCGQQQGVSLPAVQTV